MFGECFSCFCNCIFFQHFCHFVKYTYILFFVCMMFANRLLFVFAEPFYLTTITKPNCFLYKTIQQPSKLDFVLWLFNHIDVLFFVLKNVSFTASQATYKSPAYTSDTCQCDIGNATRKVAKDHGSKSDQKQPQQVVESAKCSTAKRNDQF